MIRETEKTAARVRVLHANGAPSGPGATGTFVKPARTGCANGVGGFGAGDADPAAAGPGAPCTAYRGPPRDGFNLNGSWAGM